MLYCTHVLLSAIDINICNTAQVIKSQTAFLFFCKIHLGEPWRGGNAYALTIKHKRDPTLTHTCFPAPLYPQLHEIQSNPLPIHSLFSSRLPFLNNTTHLAPHMDTSHNLVKQIRACQWFHLAVDLKFSMWSSRAAEVDCWLWGYLWAQHTGEPLCLPDYQLPHRQPAETASLRESGAPRWAGRA